MGRYGEAANHERKMLVEPEDESARIYYAAKDGVVRNEVVASCVTQSKPTDLGAYIQRELIGRFGLRGRSANPARWRDREPTDPPARRRRDRVGKRGGSRRDGRLAHPPRRM